MKLKTQNLNFKIMLILSTFYFLLSTSLCGCEAFRKKFVRKPKREKEVKVVVDTQEYESQYSQEETYKRYYTFWRSAHQELMGLLDEQDASRKRRLFFAKKIVESLEQMRKLLQPQKQSSLDSFILEQKDLVKELDKSRLSRAQTLKVKSRLKKLKKQIEQEFAFKHIQEYLSKK